jgi:N-methylhydantoinase B
VSFDAVAFQILWSRVVSIADEMAATLVKTAFSHVVRDNHDYSCAVYDLQGRMLAQSTQCTPGHIGAMPQLVKAMLAECPVETLRDGDVLITNDPWVGAGHTPDIFLATPVFRRERLIGFAVNSAHHIDIGGRLAAPEAREVYEEGLIIPISHLKRAGAMNDELLRLIRRNVRMADKVVGDLRAQIAANHIGAVRVNEFLDETGLEDLGALASQIIGFTADAMRRAIGDLPDGVYLGEASAEEGVSFTVKVRLHVEGERLTADFTGTSGQVEAAINSVWNMTYAYTLFPIKCALHPHIPNNEGCAEPISLIVPEGSILNATFPAACMWRTFVGLLRHRGDLFCAGAGGAEQGDGARREPTRSGSASSAAATTTDGLFVIHLNAQGGQGARATRDGVSTVVFPPNVMNTPIELLEGDTTLLCERKALRPDSGGPGRFRGGVAQELVIRNRGSYPVFASLIGGRLGRGAEGLFGGGSGAPGRLRVDGETLPSSRQVVIPPGGRVEPDFAWRGRVWRSAGARSGRRRRGRPARPRHTRASRDRLRGSGAMTVLVRKADWVVAWDGGRHVYRRGVDVAFDTRFALSARATRALPTRSSTAEAAW